MIILSVPPAEPFTSIKIRPFHGLALISLIFFSFSSQNSSLENSYTKILRADGQNASITLNVNYNHILIYGIMTLFGQNGTIADTNAAWGFLADVTWDGEVKSKTIYGSQNQAMAIKQTGSKITFSIADGSYGCVYLQIINGNVSYVQ